MTTTREIKEGMQEQGEDEVIVYTLTVPTSWGTSPTSPSAKIYSYDSGTRTYTDVTSTKMSGSASVVGQVITLPAVTGLVDGTTYRVEIKWTDTGNTFEPYAWIKGVR